MSDALWPLSSQPRTLRRRVRYALYPPGHPGGLDVRYWMVVDGEEVFREDSHHRTPGQAVRAVNRMMRELLPSVDDDLREAMETWLGSRDAFDAMVRQVAEGEEVRGECPTTSSSVAHFQITSTASDTEPARQGICEHLALAWQIGDSIAYSSSTALIASDLERP